MRAVIRLLVAAVVFGAVLSLTPGPATCASKWDPVDPKELAATTPTVEKGADAEALLWEIRVEDRMVSAHDAQTNFYHHLRIKIFTDRGREAQSRVDLPHIGSAHIKDVEGRSIGRDGTFTELKKADVYERTLVKAGGAKVNATSFVLPTVETGGIVEYRWTETRDNSSSNNLRLPFSRDIPIRLVRYQFAPGPTIGAVMQGQAFHPNPTMRLSAERRVGLASMENVPAHREEPYAPPDWDTQPWILVYYDLPHPKDPDEYWIRFGRGLAASVREAMSPTSEIKRAVETLPMSTGSLDQKLAALVTFCRAKIRRVDVDTATDADRKGFLPNRSPTAALNAGRGTWFDVIGLFVAMARAAGLDARLALLPSRDDVAFDRSLMIGQLLWYRVAAVRDGDRWRFVDPTNDHAPDGHPGWTQESVPALIGDKDTLVWSATPSSPPEWSLHSRTATLRLLEDGTLEGDVRIEYGGHTAMALRERDDHQAPAERETAIRDAVTSRLPGAEVTEVGVDNVADPDKPYVHRYHLKIPGYGQRTGSRLFVQPAVFQKAMSPVFAAAERQQSVFFDYGWKEVDRVLIELPAGYQLESPEAPAPLKLEPLGAYSMKLARVLDGRSIEMTREFSIGGGQRLEFPVESYSGLKRFFDEVAKADAHALTLRKAAGSLP